MPDRDWSVVAGRVDRLGSKLRAVPITAASDTVEPFHRTPPRARLGNSLDVQRPEGSGNRPTGLVQGAGRSLPLLRRFLNSSDEDLHLEAFEIIRRIGPPAVPLLADLLRHHRTSIRQNAADALIDLAPETEPIQPALRRALRDPDSNVAGDAARALGALGQRAALRCSLWSRLSRTRNHASGCTRRRPSPRSVRKRPRHNDLARALGDPIPGVRWAAGEALASVGPAAQSAVPQLIEALKDEFLYVRICAAGALGSIGPKAQQPEALRAAATDPSLRYEAEWASNQSPASSLESLSSHPFCPVFRRV